MSNFLAVATVTAAVQELLQRPIGPAFPQAAVSVERPDRLQRGPVVAGVNLFLYQVRPNQALRNADLPTRAADGRLIRRSQAALDLYYLVSFLGDETKLEPQRLLGVVVGRLHEHPTLTPDLIKAVVDHAQADPAFHDYLKDSDLADQLDRVTLTPVALELEELSNLWSVFFQTPYVTSIAYKASVVLIDAEVTPAPVLPVLSTEIVVNPRGRPRIARVVHSSGDDRPIVATDVVAVHGDGLSGAGCVVEISGTARTPTSVGDTLVVLDLSQIPTGVLRAGPQAVRVVHRPPGRPTDARAAIASGEALFTLHPTITDLVTSGPDGALTLTTDLTLGRRQRVVLALLDPATGETRHLLEPAPRDADGSVVAVPTGAVPPGRYIVQLQVDGAGSRLDRDDEGRLVGPEITL